MSCLALRTAWDGGLTGYLEHKAALRPLVVGRFHPRGACETGCSWSGKPTRKEAWGVESWDLAGPPENSLLHAGNVTSGEPARPGSSPRVLRTDAPSPALLPEKTWQPRMTSRTTGSPAVAMMKTGENGA